MKAFSINETNKVKGLAILLLIFHHMYRTTDEIAARGAVPILLTGDSISHIAYCFRICVYIFAFLTAYGLTKLLLKSEKVSYTKFVIKRYLKLLAPYWFTLVCIWLFWLFALRQSPLARYDGNILFMAADFMSVLELLGHTDKMFLGLFWYMNFAVAEIIVLPLLVVAAKKFGYYLVIISIFLYNVLPTICDSTYGGNYNSYLFIIELGVLFALNDSLEIINNTFEKMTAFKKMVIGGLLLVVSFCAPYLARFVITSEKFGVTYILQTLGAIALIVFSFTCIKNVKLSKAFEWIGSLSGDIFLLHILIYELGWRIVSFTNVIIVQYITSVILCIIASYVLAVIKDKIGYNRLTKMLISRI
ncbi:MAG: acyltransferase [Pseudobutyrivibrio ruminis]|nr:acyltransferase [Pseudobutyrivibrio ruminis]